MQYIALFKNPSDATQIAIIGRQMFPHDPTFLPAAFKLATANPYGYIFIDLRQDTPEKYRICTNILNADMLPMKIFASNK